MTVNITAPLTTIDEAKAFIENLHADGKMFHFEDSPDQIGNRVNGEWVDLWTPEECEQVSERVAELYSMDWSTVGHECPIGYALEVMDRTP